MDGAIPGGGVLGSLRKQAEHVLRNKPVSGTLQVFCISSCLRISALLEFHADFPSRTNNVVWKWV